MHKSSRGTTTTTTVVVAAAAATTTSNSSSTHSTVCDQCGCECECGCGSIIDRQSKTDNVCVSKTTSAATTKRINSNKRKAFKARDNFLTFFLINYNFCKVKREKENFERFEADKDSAEKSKKKAQNS